MDTDIKAEEFPPIEVEQDPDQEAASSSDASLLDRLRERNRELSEERPPLDLPIPGYEGAIVARYRQVEWEKIARIVKRVAKAEKKNPRADLLGFADTLILACEELFAKNDEGELRPMSALAGVEEPVRYDANLAAALGLSANGSARQVVFGLFKNDLALGEHHGELFTWMSSNREEADEDLLGES